MFKDRKLEKSIAVASFAVAAALSFTALAINEEHTIAAGATMVIAQFLTLTATILGIDYKFNPTHHEQDVTTRHPQQQPA